MFLERLAKAASEDCELNPEQPTLLGVSGGADSLAMMLGLHALGYKLVIAHVDHGLRPESSSEADYVRSLADSRGLPFYVQRVDVREVAQLERQSLEEAAREVRYRFLFEQAQRQNCKAVAVAHHADDQVETVLMHLLRGAALPGLTGMAYRRLMPQWDPDIPLVRPLLGIWREEIEAFVETLEVKPCVDLTNLDTRYYRNRIRHALIPELETYNPQIRSVIWRMADVLQAENQFLEAQTDEAFQAGLVSVSDDRIVLDRQAFLKLSTALKRRLLRKCIERLRPDLRDVGFDAIIRGVDYAESPGTTGEIDLIARLNLAVIDEALIIKTWQADLPDFDNPVLTEEQFQAPLIFDTPLNLRNGWKIVAHLMEEYPADPLKKVKTLDPDQAWLDYDRIEQPLMVRAGQEGERFQPLGMGGHSQSLQDLFINLKVPAHLRSLWPLVVSGQTVAWVVGLRTSELFKITPETRRIVVLSLVKNNPY